MTSSKVRNLLKPALLTLCAVAFSLSAFHSTSAKTRTKTASNTATTVRNAGPNAMNAREARRLLRIISRKAKLSPKLAKAMVTACGCNVAPQEMEAFGSCFRGCLRDYGVSLAQLAACGAVCTVNLYGCAVCVGVSEWVVLGCVQWCVWRGSYYLTEDGIIARAHPRDNRQTKLSSKRAPARS